MEQPEWFFDLLTAEAQDSVPVHYRRMQGHPPAEAARLRIATSDHHRADRYQCASFYKPISRYQGHEST